jgi:hypothetical protein
MNKWVILAPLLAWYIFARVRRNVGRQAFRPLWFGVPLRFGITGAFFGCASVVLALRCLNHPPLAVGWGTGLLLGSALGLLALRLTRFETTAEGRFYTPNAHLGMLLVLIFLARMAYRFSVLSGAQPAFAGQPTPPLGGSALTYLSFEGLAGYYLAYYWGILRRFHSLEPMPPAA